MSKLFLACQIFNKVCFVKRFFSGFSEKINPYAIRNWFDVIGSNEHATIRFSTRITLAPISILIFIAVISFAPPNSPFLSIVISHLFTPSAPLSVYHNVHFSPSALFAALICKLHTLLLINGFFLPFHFRTSRTVQYDPCIVFPSLHESVCIHFIP